MNVESDTKMFEVFNLAQKIDQIWKSIQTIIKDNLTCIVMILGNSSSGKTTLFNYLYGKGLNTQMNNQPQGNVNHFFDYFFFQDRYHLVLDFRTNYIQSNREDLIFEEILLRLNHNYKIKIVYTLEHLENDLQRGSHIQEFIKKYFNGSPKLSKKLIIILNKYLEVLPDEELIEKVQEQFQEIFNISSKNIFVLRQINQKQKVHLAEIIGKIWKAIVNQDPIQFEIGQFQINYNLVQLLKQIFQKPIISILNEIYLKYNEKIQTLKQQDLQNLETLLLVLLNNDENDDKWFDNHLQRFEQINNILQNRDFDYNNSNSKLKNIFYSFNTIILYSNILIELKQMIQKQCQVLLQNVNAILQQVKFKDNINIQIKENREKQQLKQNEIDNPNFKASPQNMGNSSTHSQQSISFNKQIKQTQKNVDGEWQEIKKYIQQQCQDPLVLALITNYENLKKQERNEYQEKIISLQNKPNDDGCQLI